MPKPPRKFDFRKTLADDPILLLTKLRWEVDEIARRGDALIAERIYMSLNAASTAWHIHEWLWKLCTADVRTRLAETFSLDKATAVAFGQACQLKCKALLICRQISVASKHVDVEYDRPDVYFEVWHDPDKQKYQTTVRLYCEGKDYSDVEVFEDALEWWAEQYVRLGFKHVDAVRMVLPQIRKNDM